jgi:hypothetical protein
VEAVDGSATGSVNLVLEGLRLMSAEIRANLSRHNAPG